MKRFYISCPLEAALAAKNPRAGRFVDITGMKFNMLHVIRENGRGAGGKVMWLCKCDCGEEKTIKGDDIRNGKSHSCGCYQRLRSSEKAAHGHSRRIGRASPTYNSWAAIIKRCENPNTAGYENYGGRGISVCDRWREFLNFLEDMGKRPKGKTIDRIDNNGNYEPENCKWSTPTEQSANQRKRKNKTSSYRGVSLESSTKKWKSQLRHDNKKITVGRFATEEEAYLKLQEYYKRNNLPFPKIEVDDA